MTQVFDMTYHDVTRQRHETLDILVNNAGRYEKPDTSTPAFGEQTDVILNTNYWGLKNVINGMMDIFTPGARIVNVSSHLGHLSLINGEAKKSEILREMLADPAITEKTLGQNNDNQSLRNDLTIVCRRSDDSVPEPGQGGRLGERGLA